MKLDIPFYKQDRTYTCGPVALQMAAAFLGKHASERDLARMAHTNATEGTAHAGMIAAARAEGLYCYVNEGSSLEEITQFLRLGIPIIVDYTEPSGEEGHYAVVAGRDDGKLVLNDPWNGKDFKISEKEFLARWHDKHPSGFLCERWMMALSREAFPTGKQYVPTPREAGGSAPLREGKHDML